MHTVLTKSAKRAARFIKQGGVVGFPTETVYGLAANAFDKNAVAKIFRAKGRPQDNPLIVHLASVKDISCVVDDVPLVAKKLFKAFAPGPITIILKKKSLIPHIVSAGLPTVGIRIPQLKLARDFIKACGVPLAAPSANLSGKPSATQWQHVQKDFNARIPCILKGASAQYGLESTVIDCSGRDVKILRLGAVSAEQINEVISGKIGIFKASSTKILKSPGMKYRHYSPVAVVQIYKEGSRVKGSSAFIGLVSPHSKDQFDQVKVCRSVSGYASSLYAYFRDCDLQGIQTIYCELPPAIGLGLSIIDRIQKARKK